MRWYPPFSSKNHSKSPRLYRAPSLLVNMLGCCKGAGNATRCQKSYSGRQLDSSDSVEWHYLFDCLKAFNFGPDLINWVKTFYRNIESCVINNGLTSDYFTLARGVRQGDPLSPYLFLLVIETLAISIRKNPEMEGIKIGNNETKVLQYADDTTAVLSNLDSANALFQQLDLLKNLCGLEINSSNTEGMWIGSQKNNDEKPLGISEPIKALGVFFTYDQALLYEKKFQHRLDNMKKLTNIWSSRGLSIYGKVTMIKSLLIPKLVYVSSLLPTPLKIIKQVNHIIFTFLWKGKGKVTRLSAIYKHSRRRWYKNDRH